MIQCCAIFSLMVTVQLEKLNWLGLELLPLITRKGSFGLSVEISVPVLLSIVFAIAFDIANFIETGVLLA